MTDKEIDDIQRRLLSAEQQLDTDDVQVNPDFWKLLQAIKAEREEVARQKASAEWWERNAMNWRKSCQKAWKQRDMSAAAHDSVQKDCWNLTEKVIPNLRAKAKALEARLDAALGLPADRLLANGDYYVLHSKIKAALEGSDGKEN